MGPALLAAEVHFESQLAPARLIATIHRERISVLAAVPRVLELLKAHFLTKYPTLAADWSPPAANPPGSTGGAFEKSIPPWASSSGRSSAAAHRCPQELEEFWNTLGFALIQGYGLTETAALVTLNHPFKIGKGTIGKPLPGRDVRIGENGEILVRGEMLSTTTWQAGHLQHRDQEWLNTGDMAAQDASGELRFLGRKSDVIVTPSGMNIHATDLESAVNKQPGVGACVVVPCTILQTQEPVAVVIFSGADEQLQAAIRTANRELAEYQQIRSWLRWSELNFPYTSTGKLLRRKVAEWACAALAGRDASAPGRRFRPSAQTDRLDYRRRPESRNRRLAALRRPAPRQPRACPAAISPGAAPRHRAARQRYRERQHTRRASQPAPLTQLANCRDRNGRRTSVYRRSNIAAPGGAATPQDDHIYPHWPWWTPVQLLRVLFVEAVMRPLVWLLAAPRVVRQTNELPAKL